MKKYLGIFLIAALVLVGGVSIFGELHVAKAEFFCGPPGSDVVLWSNGNGTSTCGTCNGSGTGIEVASPHTCGAIIVHGNGSGNPPTQTLSQCQGNILINGGGNCCADASGSYSWQTLPCAGSILTSGGGATPPPVAVCTPGQSVCSSGLYYTCSALTVNGFPTGDGYWGTGQSGVPGCGLITAGGNVGANTGLTPILNWSPVTGATSYSVSISTDKNFTTLVTKKTVTGGNTYRVYPPGNSTVPTSGGDVVGTLKANTTYYWKVQACNIYGCSADSTVWSFTTAPTPKATAAVMPPPSNPCDVNPFGAGCPLSGGAGLIAPSKLISSLANAGAQWVTSSGTAANTDGIRAEVDYYNESGARIFPSKTTDAQKIVSIINSLVAGKSVTGGTSPTQMLDNCHGVALGAVSGNARCCVDNGGGSQSLYITPISDAACYALIVNHGTSTASTSVQ